MIRNIKTLVPDTFTTGSNFWQKSLHIFALSSLTVAQPILDLLSRTPEFFAVRRLGRIDIAALVVGLLVVVPLPFIAIEGLLTRAPRRVQGVVHLLFIWFFGALVAALVVKGIEGLPATAALGIAALGGAVLAALYARTAMARSFASLLAIALLAVPAVFLANPQVTRLLRGRPASHPDLPRLRTTAPIVFIIFDGFSQSVLLDGNLQINRHRFPNLAELADTSTWFQNAIAAAEKTSVAIPAILSGFEPVSGRLPTAVDHPQNLFTAFGGSYKLWVDEPASQLCPEKINHRATTEENWMDRFGLLVRDLEIVYLHVLLPEEWNQYLPVISGAWSAFDPVDEARPKQSRISDDWQWKMVVEARRATKKDRQAFLDRFIDVASQVSTSELFFLHVLLPHEPWDLLPDGRRYLTGSGWIPGLARDGWGQERFLADQAYQRYILQTMYVDGAIGRLMDGLRISGRFDETLLVLVADHGFSFTPGEHHRLISKQSAHEIMLVPLLIKAPHQRDGRIVRQRVSTLDVLPTVFEILGEEPPWPMEGVSRATSAARPPAAVKFFRRNHGFVELAPSVLNLRRPFVRTKLRRFGDGSDVDDVYRMGPFSELFGTPTKDLEILDALNWKMHVEAEDAYRDVRLDSSDLPAFFRATVRPPRRVEPGQRIAVAVNGVVVATALTYAAGKKSQGISAMLLPSAFREGDNEVEVFKVIGGPGRLALRPVLRD